MEQKYTNEGVSILFPYKEGLVAEFPKSCSDCPVGFRWGIEGGCGIPDYNSDHRPPTCKLKLLTINNIEVNPDDELE